MESNIITFLLEKGSYGALFIVLFIYVMRTTENREKAAQKREDARDELSQRREETLQQIINKFADNIIPAIKQIDERMEDMNEAHKNLKMVDCRECPLLRDYHSSSNLGLFDKAERLYPAARSNAPTG